MLFDSASEMLDKAFDIGGDTIVYGRDDLTVSIKAKLAQTGARIEQYNASFFQRFSDFIVREADLGELFPPQIGDTIVYGDRTFYVTAPPNEPHWRDHNRRSPRQIRIHTLNQDFEQ